MKKRLLLPEFLRDVLLLSLSAFGGPQAHLSVFLQHLVYKKHYLSEAELIQINSLCNLLPGPTSTQTLTAIGHKLGGPRLAFLTLMIWLLPAFLLMTTVAIAYVTFEGLSVKTDFARYLQPMAIGFIFFSALKLRATLVKSPFQWSVMLIACLLSFFVRSSIVFPLVLFLAGWIGARGKNNQRPDEGLKLKPRWGNLYLFLGIFVASVLVGNVLQIKPVLMFENTFRYGSLVFGGGQVLVPMLFEQFVLNKHYLSSAEFLTGWGIAQAIPGPVFTFTAFTHALALKEWGNLGMLAGATIGTVGIFLPGTLLIFFVYPAWESLKKWPLILNMLNGINAAACGFVFSAAFLLAKTVIPTPSNSLMALFSFISLYYLKLPAVLVVFMTILIGLIT